MICEDNKKSSVEVPEFEQSLIKNYLKRNQKSRTRNISSLTIGNFKKNTFNLHCHVKMNYCFLI